MEHLRRKHQLAHRANRNLATILLEFSETDIPGVAPDCTVTGALSATDGDILLSANQQTDVASGDFHGIFVNQSSVTTTGTGTVTLLGRGGIQSTTNRVGVFLAGATISGSSTTVTGTGGEQHGRQ